MKNGKHLILFITCCCLFGQTFCQSSSKKKFHSFKIKGGFRVRVAGRYFDNDTIPVNELLKKPIVEIQGYKDSIQILSYDVIFHWRGTLNTFSTTGVHFSKEAIAGMHLFMVDNPIFIKNIKCKTAKGILPIIKTLKLIVFVPHEYIVTGYTTYLEDMHFWDVFTYKGPKITHSSKLGIIIKGDTIIPKDTNNQHRYIRLSGNPGLGSIVINLDSISGPDSMKHYPSLEIWGSFYGDPHIDRFNMTIDMNTDYISATNQFTRPMVIALSKCKPGTVVWLDRIFCNRGFLGRQFQDYKFTVASYMDVNN